MKRPDKRLLAAFLLQAAALAFVVLIYLFLRGVAEEPESPLPLPPATERAPPPAR